MRTLLFLTIRVIVYTTIVTACHPNDPEQEAPSCTYVHQVKVDSECYAGNGLKLVAADYGSSPDGFEWKIIALKDTSTSWGWTPKDEKLNMLGISTFTVPDSLVTNYKGLIVRVATNCKGDLKYSKYYGLTKSNSTTGNCSVWRIRSN